MPNTPEGMRECPTRADGDHALFAHVIHVATCQERQRRHYHKCPTCSFYNARRNGAAHNGAVVNGARVNGADPGAALGTAEPAPNRLGAAEAPARSR